VESPFRQSEVRQETYNNTEVELARIREAEETKRQKTTAREKTRQAAYGSEGYWTRNVHAIVALVILGIVGAFVHNNYMDARYPKPVSALCVETAEIVTVNTESRRCLSGGWFEATPTGKPGEIYIRCRCDARPVVPTVPVAPAASH
jgi:hypothetical protein